MSEHKIVNIDLEESETVTLGGRSSLDHIDVSGVLKVTNPSNRCRVWNVKVHLGETGKGTGIRKKSLPGGEIDAGGKWETYYTVGVKSPLLALTEVYDTSSGVETEEPHWAYVFGVDNPIKMTIQLKNDSGGQIDNILLNKTIPPELSEVTIESVTSGVAEFDEGTSQIVWKDFTIYPEESSTLVVTAIGKVANIKSKVAGEIVVTYRAEEQQRSELDPDLTALTEFLTGIENAETEPNHWECTLECSNESDLMIRLEKATVFLVPEGGGKKEQKIDENPAFEMAPNQDWSAKFDIESKSPPKCSQDVIYTPMRTVTKRVLGTIEKTAQIIPVARIGYTKVFEPPAVDSFDKTPVEVTIEITNSGSAKLNEILVEDDLPDDVMPPLKEHITVWIRGKEYTGDFEFIKEPNDQDPETAHKLTFRMSNLKDSVGELAPGESVKINYAIMAWKSRPEKEYPSPILCSANTHPAGLPATELGEDHKLEIVYKKRSISTKKAINKGADIGEYIVVLVVENRGEVTAENVVVKDWIPPGFEYVSVDPEELVPSVKPARKGSNVTWTFTRMNPGEKKRIRLSVSGEGEYERREPQVTSD
ncbi:MAG: hypothetical protein V3T87_00540 [Candidatus Thorarchaeota archaeon]